MRRHGTAQHADEGQDRKQWAPHLEPGRLGRVHSLPCVACPAGRYVCTEESLCKQIGVELQCL